MSGQYRIEYAPPGSDDQPVKDQGWRVYQASYHKHRQGSPIKRSTRQRPRWRLLQTFETQAQAEDYIKTLSPKN